MEPSNAVATAPAKLLGQATRPPTATLLAVLLQERNWHRYGVFRVEYERAARALDRALVATTPSRAQWHRWLAGELRRLPYVDHCRVLEAMFPGWSARQLLSLRDEEQDVSPREVDDLPLARLPPAAPEPTTEQPGSGPYADVTAIFTSRTEFMANVSPMDIFGRAREIRAAGLSLNMLCQNLADQQLIKVIQDGTRLHALFLRPDSEAIRRREVEEGIADGHLSTLTSLNIDMLLRLRGELEGDLRDRIIIGTYDETIRFNITLIDDDLCVAQPYLPATRGIDSPTFVIRRSHDKLGLYDAFARTFDHLAEHSILL